MSGTVSDAHLDQVTVNGRAATVTAGTFQATGIPLTEGDNVLRVRAVDLAGNATEVEHTVSRDTLAPEVVITDPSSGTVVGETTYTLSGTAADPHLDRVEIAGQVAQLTGD